MGYYSDFNMEIDKPIEKADEINNFIESHEKYKYAYIHDMEYWNGKWYANMKWYNCEEEMKEFSKFFPDVLFIIDVRGEEFGDFWKLYVRNGKAQKCYSEIVYDDFNEEYMR